MLRSQLFPPSFSKEDPKDEVAPSAKLLLRAGFIDKLAGGIYSILPLGLKVLDQIATIIREEMTAIGGQELFMPALQPPNLWQETGRWESAREVMYQFQDSHGHSWGLGFTHEEIITDIVRKRVSSFRDLPLYLFQIQTKFRNEPRVTSGLLRGREFMMKDLYSFHGSAEDCQAYYERAAQAYQRIFTRCGLEAIRTEASGGLFSPRSHEYQVLAEVGEDTIYYCPRKDYAYNKEIHKSESRCPAHPQEEFIQGRAIEVGNIFPLGTRFSEPMGALFADPDGKRQPIIMGCYGIGLGRTLATIVEVSHDDKGIIWPKSVAPYLAHILPLSATSSEKSGEIFDQAKNLYHALQKQNIAVLLDDRQDASAGEKFAESDLLGIPFRIVVSAKSLAQEAVEVKKRDEKEVALVPYDQVGKFLITSKK